MKLLHPLRFWRECVRVLRMSLFILRCRINHVEYHLGKGIQLYRSYIVSKGSGTILIGDNCVIRNCTFGFYGTNGKIIVGDNSKINARPDARTGLYVKDGTTITLGERSLISNSVEIATTDWHRMINERGETLNGNRDVHIGEHVWICRRSLIGKGVFIGDDSVVGAGSIVTKAFPDHRLLIVGNPASVKKQNISWK